MNKDNIINAKIIEAMANGMDLKEAFDSVLGEGAYIKIASYMYDVIRSKQDLSTTKDAKCFITDNR